MLSLITSTYCLPLSFVSSAGGTGDASASDASLSSIAGGDPLSIVLVCLLSPVISGGLLSAIFGCSLTLVAGSSPLFAISGCLSFCVISRGLLSAIFGRPLSLVTSVDPLFTISDGDPLSPMFSISSWLLFLTSTPSHTYRCSLSSLLLFHSFLSSSSTLLARNPTLLTGKRLFDQAFITQRPIVSI